jgi:sulfide:quinone oxidoreductase
MVNIRKLDDGFSAAGQLGPTDIVEVKGLGYATVINNRPDSEIGLDEPSSVENRKAAEAAGLTYFYLPMTPDTLSRHLLDAFNKALEQSDGPVLAHCASGARSTALWAIVQCVHRGADIAQTLERTRQAGYQLDNLRPVIEKHRDSGRGED